VASPSREDESSSVGSVVSLAARCLWTGLLFGDPNRGSRVKAECSHQPETPLCFNLNVPFFVSLVKACTVSYTEEGMASKRHML